MDALANILDVQTHGLWATIGPGALASAQFLRKLAASWWRKNVSDRLDEHQKRLDDAETNHQQVREAIRGAGIALDEPRSENSHKQRVSGRDQED